MGIVDLRELEGDEVVIHFGGELQSVDAYTFANSLVAFADATRAINHVINPGQSIELRLEATGPGSFKARVKKLHRGAGGFFARGAENLLWTTVGLVFIQPLLQPDAKITVNSDEVIFEYNGDRVIVPRSAYDQIKNVEADPEVHRSIRRTFHALEQDDAIENFGITRRISDRAPLIQVPRADFGRMAEPPSLVEDSPTRRHQTEKARLLVLKAWFSKSPKKWQFEWNGVPISAPIKDDAFWNRVEQHELLFGNGDALDVILEFDQDRDETLNMWVNDTTTFVVTEVIRHIPRSGRQGTLSV